MFVLGLISSLAILAALAPAEDDATYNYNVKLCAVFLLSSVYFSMPAQTPLWWVTMTAFAYIQLWFQFWVFFDAVLKSKKASGLQKIDNLLYPLVFYIGAITMFSIAAFDARNPNEADMAFAMANLFTTLTAGSLYAGWSRFCRESST